VASKARLALHLFQRLRRLDPYRFFTQIATVVDPHRYHPSRLAYDLGPTLRKILGAPIHLRHSSVGLLEAWKLYRAIQPHSALHTSLKSTLI